MTRKATTARPLDFRIGDTLAAGRHRARIVRMSHTTLTVRLGTLNYELDRRRLGRDGAATVRGRTFCVASNLPINPSLGQIGPDIDQEAAPWNEHRPAT